MKHPRYRSWNLLFLVLLTTHTLSGCTPVLVASAVVTTVDIIHDRRTVGEYIDDSGIELTAGKELIASKEFRDAANVKPVSWNGILLLTGEIDNEATQRRVVDTLASIQGVRQVVDETVIATKSNLSSRTSDGWISTKIKSKMVAKTGLDANRIKTVTTQGTVYLMGIVTEAEAERAVDIARSVKGVSRVVKVFEYQQ